MRDSSARLPANSGPSQSRPVTRVSSSDEPSDALRAFASEEAQATTHLVPVEAREARVSVQTASEHTPGVTDTMPVVPVAAPRDWRTASLVVVTLFALAQAGFIAFWMLSGSAIAAPPDTGSVAITSEPAGAAVAIDGTPSGVTPLAVTLATGSHRIDVGEGPQLRGHDLSIVGGGVASLHFGLAPVAAEAASATGGGLQVTTEPDGARVFVDGEARGVSPVTLTNLAVGDHTVTVRGTTGEAINRTVSIKAAAVSSLVISMTGSAGVASGWLTVTSAVPLQIMSRGALVGTSDMPRVMLPAGSHDLELVNTALGYRTTHRVQVSAGHTTSFTPTLPNGTLSINALPWAEVWINGRRVGETPIGNHSIAIGTHEVVFRHPDLGEQRRTVTIGASVPARLGIDMRKQ